MLQRSCAINRDTHDAFWQKQVIFAAQGPLHAYLNQSETAGGQFRTSNMWTAHIWTWFWIWQRFVFEMGENWMYLHVSWYILMHLGLRKLLNVQSYSTLISFILTLFSHHIVLIKKHVTSFFFGRKKRSGIFYYHSVDFKFVKSQ